MNVLYVTYDGITDHIGQSQVAPYLLGLAKNGHSITLLSVEKMERGDIIKKYKELFRQGGVEWHFTAYHKNPPVVSTVFDIMRVRQVAAKLIRKNSIEIIHCRGYVPALIGLHFKRTKGIKFIFDMRDFWPDAAKEIRRFDVDNNRLHRAIYNFFKKKERQFLQEADQVISLTESGRKVMEEWSRDGYVDMKAPVTVIPCCADFSVFDPARIDPSRLEQLRKKLGLDKTDFVCNYLGSLGPSYLTDEMMEVFSVLLEKKPNAKFLVVANNDHHLATEAAARKQIPMDRIIVTRGNKEEIPYLISLSDLSLFFIIPSFAKQACSPTKLAELLAMKVPVIANTKVGDLDTILDLDKNNSTVVHSFDRKEYARVLDEVLSRIGVNEDRIREDARAFSLPRGIELYDGVYRRTVDQKHPVNY